MWKDSFHDIVHFMILLISLHQDDAFIACAGYALKSIKAGKKVGVLCIAGHKKSNNKVIKDNYGQSCMIKNTSFQKERNDEESTAWKKISPDIKVDYLSECDTYINCNSRLISCLEDYIASHFDDQSVKIFTPYHTDTHQDHVETTKAVLSSCRYNNNVIFYETPSTFNFFPTVFSEMDKETFDSKVEIGKSYSSQILGRNLKLSIPEIISANAISNGVKSRVCQYAEGFIPHKLFI